MKQGRLDFVVVASCHSECVGNIFFNAGINHVICVNKKKALRDDAAIIFSKTFYYSVFSSSYSVCDAFA